MTDLTDPASGRDDSLDVSLRPSGFSEFIGQEVARPNWPFTFFFAGAITIAIWSILMAVTAMGTDVAQAEGFLDLTQSYGIIAFVVALAWWGITGAVFGWLEKPGWNAERRG